MNCRKYYVYGTSTRMARICTKRTSAGSVLPVCLISSKQSKKRTILTEDSTWLGVDTLSTYCLTNDENDFIESPHKMDQNIVGINGITSKTKVTKVGHGRFTIIDDNGATCKLDIPELYLCTTVPYKIISPQHLDNQWRQRKMGSFHECTNGSGTMIEWIDTDGNKHKKTIEHNNRSGIPVCYTAPKYSKFKKYLQTNGQIHSNAKLLINMLAHGDKSGGSKNEPIRQVDQFGQVIRPAEEHLIDTNINTMDKHDTNKEELRNQPITFEVDDINNENTTIQHDEFQDLTPKSEKLLWHYRLGHVPFKVINKLANQGALPKRLASAPDPMCSSCMFGRLTKRPWRTKGSTNQVSGNKTITNPGHCVSVDQL
jgi:GAG-pre-integrase domain